MSPIEPQDKLSCCSSGVQGKYCQQEPENPSGTGRGHRDADFIACGHCSCLSQADCKKETGSKTLVSGHIVGWETSAAFPLAQLRASLGQAGELATEMQVRMSFTLQRQGM